MAAGTSKRNTKAQTTLIVPKTFKKNNPRRPEQHTVAPINSGETIAVGCKLPHGIHMDLRRTGSPTERFTLKGTNSQTAGMIIRPATIGGFAVTTGVPKEFFDEWMRQNQHHPSVVNHLIFAHQDVASVQDMGEERSELQHGLEPLDPAKPGSGVTPLSDKD